MTERDAAATNVKVVGKPTTIGGDEGSSGAAATEIRQVPKLVRTLP